MLNQRHLDAAIRAKQASFLWATSPMGFGARVLPSGKASFIFSFRVGTGRAALKRTLTLGSTSSLSIADARAIALKHAASVAAGSDPAATRDEARHRQTVAKGHTVAILVPAFVERHHRARGHRQADEVLRTLHTDAVRVWGTRPVHEITSIDASNLLNQVTGRGSPGQTRRLYLALSRFFRWCVENHFVRTSPMGAVGKPTPPSARDRVLTDTEISLLWQACDDLHPAYSACVRFLILTGARRNEVARAKWSEFDMQASTWTLPAERSKNKRSHISYLSPQASAILETLPRDGDFVFWTQPGVPLAGFSKVRIALQSAACKLAARCQIAPPKDDWVFHDLRRSLVSWLAGNGVSVYVADRLLNHISGAFSGVLGTYQRHQFSTERRNALAAWNTHVLSLANWPAPLN